MASAYIHDHHQLPPPPPVELLDEKKDRRRWRLIWVFMIAICSVVSLKIIQSGRRVRGLGEASWMTSTSFPSDVESRVGELVWIGPTSYYQALTYVPEDSEAMALYDSELLRKMDENGRELKLAEALEVLRKRYNMSGEDLTRAEAEVEELKRQWREASDLWLRKVKAHREWFGPSAGETEWPAPLQEDIAICIPCKGSRAQRSWMSLESLLTLRVWPEEVVIASGVEEWNDPVYESYVGLSLLLRMLYGQYHEKFHPKARVKFVHFLHSAGPWSARYAAFLATKSALVTFTDNDDYVVPERIKLLSYYFQLHPELDYLLNGYIALYMHEHKDTKTFIEEGMVQFGNKSHESVTELLKQKDHAAETDFFSSVKEQFPPEKRLAYVLGSIVGVPNLGIQHYRIRNNYTQVIDHYRNIVLHQEHAHSRQISSKVPAAIQSTPPDYPALTNYREIKDRQYLETEMQLQSQEWEKRCHNGWPSGRRQVFLSIPPPTVQWQGEDAAYNFMIYQSPFNAGCLPYFAAGGYVSWTSIMLAPSTKS